VTGLLARLVMALHLARLVPVARRLRMRLDDRWLGVQCETANRYATQRQRERARMYGEAFALTGRHAVGWPCRYLDEFADGAESVPWPFVL
jgi:hypothetical protein